MVGVKRVVKVSLIKKLKPTAGSLGIATFSMVRKPPSGIARQSKGLELDWPDGNEQVLTYTVPGPPTSFCWIVQLAVVSSG